MRRTIVAALCGLAVGLLVDQLRAQQVTPCPPAWILWAADVKTPGLYPNSAFETRSACEAEAVAMRGITKQFVYNCYPETFNPKQATR